MTGRRFPPPWIEHASPTLPARAVSRSRWLANRRLQPLGHISGGEIAYRSEAFGSSTDYGSDGNERGRSGSNWHRSRHSKTGRIALIRAHGYAR
jgi:hypothetical protein